MVGKRRVDQRRRNRQDWNRRSSAKVPCGRRRNQETRINWQSLKITKANPPITGIYPITPQTICSSLTNIVSRIKGQVYRNRGSSSCWGRKRIERKALKKENSTLRLSVVNFRFEDRDEPSPRQRQIDPIDHGIAALRHTWPIRGEACAEAMRATSFVNFRRRCRRSGRSGRSGSSGGSGCLLSHSGVNRVGGVVAAACTAACTAVALASGVCAVRPLFATRNTSTRI